MTTPAEAAREKLQLICNDGADLSYRCEVDCSADTCMCAATMVERILAAFPQITIAPVTPGAAVEAAHGVVAAEAKYHAAMKSHPLDAGEHYEDYREAVCGAEVAMARYILTLAPGQSVIEGAREIVAQSELICGPCGASLPNPDCGHTKNGVVGCCVPSTDQPLVDRIAAFAIAHAAAETTELRKQIAYLQERIDNAHWARRGA